MNDDACVCSGSKDIILRESAKRKRLGNRKRDEKEDFDLALCAAH